MSGAGAGGGGWSQGASPISGMKRSNSFSEPEAKRQFNVGGKARPTLGAPNNQPRPPGTSTYVTQGKVMVVCEVEDIIDPIEAVRTMSTGLDNHRGVLLSSSYEYPGRYSQWTMGFMGPPIGLEAWGLRFRITALTPRGKPFLAVIQRAVREASGLMVGGVQPGGDGADYFEGTVQESKAYFPEEERSKQPSIFSVVRVIKQLFESDEDSFLGLYGAFGYDLAFQFEKVKPCKERDADQRDLVLYIPDEIVVINHVASQAWRMRYDFVFGGKDGVESTKGIPRSLGRGVPFRTRTQLPAGVKQREFEPGEFAKLVDVAKGKFARGDLFEAVLSQTFREPCKVPPSVIFQRLQERNPSPYGFQINLGNSETLVGASPEMFVRAECNAKGMRVETCPISGTIRRGKNALEDAEAIRAILTDPKEESEITMCTDVDRNDKSRICEHGSVQVIGRRQIEMYSRLIHTVDHVEGYLRPEFDALDAFLVHMWAVTVCGAPKTWAVQFVEEMERTQRRWYGASVGHVAFDGHLNTGLTLRTVRIHDGIAEVRAGATLLFDSDPDSEERETELKASACLNAVTSEVPAGPAALREAERAKTLEKLGAGHGQQVLLIDFEDSFVHTLANYLRQTGAKVVTVRHNQAEHAMASLPKVDLAVLSPGPGRPTDFKVSAHIQRLLDRKIPIFGVCLGLQSIVEHFGGTLNQLSYPMHGKPSKVTVTGEEAQQIFKGMPETFGVARYHSLYAEKLPDCLVATAHLSQPDDGLGSNGRKGDIDGSAGGAKIIMGVQHKTLPVAAVQFHPESILTSPDHGLQMLENALRLKFA